MLTGGVKHTGVRAIRAKEAQEVADDCQTQEDFRAEKSKKTGGTRQHHHDLSRVEEDGDSRSGGEGRRKRKKGGMMYLWNS